MRWLALSIALFAVRIANADETSGTQKPVGYDSGGAMLTPVNQVVTPFGELLDLPGLRPQAVALSPDGKLLLTAGKTSELIVVDATTNKIRQRVTLPSESLPPTAPVSDQILNPDEEGQLSYTGLIFSPDGRRVYMSNVEGSIKIFRVEESGRVTPEGAWPLPPAKAPRRKAEIPSGLAMSADGARLYVCGNLSNQLFELDATTGKVLRTFEVGVAPYDVALVGGHAVLSNWGGRRPGEGDLTGPAGRGTTVRVDPVLNIASEGSVSIVPLSGEGPPREVLTGLHASGLAASPDGKHIVCCNAASDNLSVIDVAAAKVVATIWTKRNASELLGAAPNAVAFSAQGDRLYVANGSQNAMAVIDFDAAEPHESKLVGLIPVGWYPGAVALDAARNRLVVANIKGLAKLPEPDEETGVLGYNSHQYHGSLSFVPLPKDEELPALSERVARNMRRPWIEQSLLPARPNQPPRAVPERIGEPSLIEHVVYIIKENRTYDQVFGALPQGNGDPALCIFGREITPNHHALAEQFVLLDNAYCCGILSADGHQWSTTAYSTDYMEKSFAGFPRSYPDGMGIDEDDALAYAPSGFIWDNALKHQKAVRNYGEFMGPEVRWSDAKRKGEPNFMDCYRAWKKGDDTVKFASWPSVETMRPFSPTDFVGWDMDVPDGWRADYILRELKQYEERGEYPALTIICLPQDHTSGTSPNCPTPRACVADNDLALGRIVEGLSRSKFWPKMAIFAIEDDPQAGWDHVSGYRTISLCVSPYAKRKAVVSTQYNTTSLIRTMEQILGLPPMNQFDASATPMFDCFTDTPDLTPYASTPNLVALDELNPNPQAINDPVLRRDAEVSASLNFRQVDRAPEDVLNRILWRAMRGSAVPYPTWAITVTEDDDDEEDEEFDRD
jgi:YVTN family beta-propeller protein